MSSDRIIFSTAPLRGPGLDQLRELGELVLDPWIDQRPLRLYDAEALAARAAEVGASVLICEADHCKGPVLDLPAGGHRLHPRRSDQRRPARGHGPGHPRAAGARAATPTPWPSSPSG